MTKRKEVSVTYLKGGYRWMIENLSVMDERQLLEFFHDLDNIKAVQRIADTAYSFLENYVEPEEGEHESVDWKRQDDAQRAADINSIKDTYK